LAPGPGPRRRPARRNCIVGKGVYIDFDVRIGDNVKIQNGCFVYHGATLEDGVLLGPGVILTNDKFPRAINVQGTLKSDADWEVGRVLIKRGASWAPAWWCFPTSSSASSPWWAPGPWSRAASPITGWSRATRRGCEVSSAGAAGR